MSLELGDRLRPAPPAKFFFAISSAEPRVREVVHRILENEVGRLGEPSKPYSFSQFSDYYDRELGGEVWKYFVSSDTLSSPEQIVPVKLEVENVQRKLARNDQTRTINIDPGYLNGWQVVLATVKNHAHRIYLSGGIFAEVTLVYRKGSFETLPWTYPDYAAPEVIKYLEALRSEYLRQLSE